MIKRYLHIVILLVLASACTEKVDVNLDTTYTRLVIDGSIDADTGMYIVDLTTTADYFYNSPVPRVTDATVTLTDGQNTYPLTETNPGVSGKYTTSPGFFGTVGKVYTLKVELANPIDDQTVYEASSKLNSVTTLDSVSAIFHPDWGPAGIWGIQLWAQEPGDEVNFYLFNLYKNGVLLTDTITKKVVSDDRFFNGSYMNGVEAVYLNDENPWESIKPGDTITLQMCGITEEYYNYINQVQQAGYSIPFFSGPPANVQGNVNNGGVGFFSAWSSSWATSIVPDR